MGAALRRGELPSIHRQGDPVRPAGSPRTPSRAALAYGDAALPRPDRGLPLSFVEPLDTRPSAAGGAGAGGTRDRLRGLEDLVEPPSAAPADRLAVRGPLVAMEFAAVRIRGRLPVVAPSPPGRCVALPARRPVRRVLRPAAAARRAGPRAAAGDVAACWVRHCRWLPDLVGTAFSAPRPYRWNECGAGRDAGYAAERVDGRALGGGTRRG